MKKNMQGFTLIELMIVIAIIAILLVIAIPAYQDYTIRTKVTEGLNLAAAAKLAVAETAAAEGGLGTVTAANSGYSFPAAGSEYVQSIGIANGGQITITTRQTGATVQPIMTLTPAQANPSAPLTWVCAQTAGQPQHVPASCRP